jgi:hypothetical protein
MHGVGNETRCVSEAVPRFTHTSLRYLVGRIQSPLSPVSLSIWMGGKRREEVKQEVAVTRRAILPTSNILLPCDAHTRAITSPSSGWRYSFNTLSVTFLRYPDRRLTPAIVQESSQRSAATWRDYFEYPNRNMRILHFTCPST